MKIKVDKFILLILVVVLLAYFFPQGEESKVPLNTLASIGVSFIFFFYGLKLSPEKIKSGLKNWKLHTLVQLSTFLLFPFIILLFYPFINSDSKQTFWLSFMFLAALPSTVSSSVVMVSIAKGNIPSAIFNASISGLLGIFITPLWMGFFLTKASEDFEIGSIYIKLITEILLPVFVGILLQKKLGHYVQKYNNYFSNFDKSIILLIVYKSFSESFINKMFSSVSISYLILVFVFCAILFILVFKITGWLSDLLKFNREDKITAQYCGTKKSLVHGTVFSKILFQDFVSVGLILLPLMVFHAFQIFVVSVIANKMAKNLEKK